MAENKKLISEISSLLKQMGSDDLLYLKQQASLLIYNKTIDQINEQNQSSSPRKEKTQQKTKKAPAAKANNEIYLDMSENRMYVYISSAAGERVFFTVEEIAQMVEVCHKSQEVRQIPLYLFRWLKKERSDFLSELSISQASDPLMRSLCIKLLEEWGE